MTYYETGPIASALGGTMSEAELRYEILRLLRLHGEMGNHGLPALKDLARATRQREREVRRVCAIMEALDYVRGHHSAGGDENPTYEITIEGLVMLHKREHSYGNSFFDEALNAMHAAPEPTSRDVETPGQPEPPAENPADKAQPKPD
ncbi:MAG: hypothetical protein HYY34_03750 [Chloroflexi bacterium]|nr:hypothetical protein [Chloroflexota bacterium]